MKLKNIKLFLFIIKNVSYHLKNNIIYTYTCILERGMTLKQCKSKIINRLNRLEGQFKGIKKMMEVDKDCFELVTQLLAIRSAINSLIGVILMEQYKELKENGDETKAKELEKIEKLIIKK